jgi:carbon monoxide dehydrogenase subunit G
MKITGEIAVAAPRAKVFDALCDARFFASCIEGVGDLTAVGDNRYEATLETKMAYIRLNFKVTVEVMRIDPPHEIEAKVEGVPIGVVGRLAATSVTRLAGDGDATTIGYEIDASLTGKLGALGAPVMKAKAKEMEKAFASRLRAAFVTEGAR